MAMIGLTFTEDRIAQVYNYGFANLLDLWNGRPVQHAGYFADTANDDYRTAAERTSQLLMTEAGIERSSRVLDIGCGTGDFAIHAAERLGCRAVGVDLSQAHIDFATGQLAGQDGLDVTFDCGSATQLPYGDESFTHVVSQDALYHIDDKPRAHAEIFRVLEPGGVLTFSDFLQPTDDVSEHVRPHIYDRMLRNGGYSLVEYQLALQQAGFEIMLARNLDHHFRRSYLLLAKMARDHAATVSNQLKRRAMQNYLASCLQIQAAVVRREIGWGIFVARKPDASAIDGQPSENLISALSGKGRSAHIETHHDGLDQM